MWRDKGQYLLVELRDLVLGLVLEGHGESDEMEGGRVWMVRRSFERREEERGVRVVCV